MFLEAANGDEALRVTQKYSGQEIHILFTDVVMPQMGGKELAHRFSALRPSTKILFTSGYGNDSTTPCGMPGDETAFIQKPFTPSTLADKVRQVLDC